jgi:hypothetical protein
MVLLFYVSMVLYASALSVLRIPMGVHLTLSDSPLGP